jgi:DNA-binding HxlR family transcriptional regulator
MSTMRSYGDACGIARALDLVGERWALLVVRELLLGPKRFTDLKTGLPHASPNVLAQRLRELEQAGVVRRRKLGPPAGSRVYELTDWGRQLEPLILQLGRWGSRAPLPPDATLGADSLLLHLKALFDPPAVGLSASYELRLGADGEDRFRVQVADGQLQLARGSADHPDATIQADPDALAALLGNPRQLAAAQRSGAVTIGGDRQAVARLLGLFPQPEPAAGT